MLGELRSPKPPPSYVVFYFLSNITFKKVTKQPSGWLGQNKQVCFAYDVVCWSCNSLPFHLKNSFFASLRSAKNLFLSWNGFGVGNLRFPNILVLLKTTRVHARPPLSVKTFELKGESPLKSSCKKESRKDKPT